MICQRYNKFHISLSVYNAWRHYSIHREARFLSKILRKGQRKSLKGSNIPKSTSMSDYARNMLNSPATKRSAVLNKVFMDHICDLTVTGKYSEELKDMGIKVVQVNVSPNYHVLFVYWIHTIDIDEEKANKLLLEVAAYLRFELSSLKIMGRVPEVRFVKHEQFLDREIIEKIITDLSITRQIEEEAVEVKNEKIKYKNNQLVKLKDLSDIDLVLSNMSQNVYGLNRNKIIENIIGEKMKQNQSISLEGEIKSQIRRDASETLRFDKKMLSRTIFKDLYDLRKQRRLNKQLLLTIQSEDSEDNKGNDEDENFYEYSDNDQYSDSYQDEEQEATNLNDDSCRDKVVKPKEAN